MNNKIRLNRLNHFVEVLKAVPKRKFKMETWYNSEYFENEQCVKVPDTFLNMSCRTAGCALGWASLDKKFNKAGLKFIVANADSGNTRGRIQYQEYRGCDAGSSFFGITYSEAYDIFVNFDSYGCEFQAITPAMVAKKVKALIKQYTK